MFLFRQTSLPRKGQTSLGSTKTWSCRIILWATSTLPTNMTPPCFWDKQRWKKLMFMKQPETMQATKNHEEHSAVFLALSRTPSSVTSVLNSTTWPEESRSRSEQPTNLKSKFLKTKNVHMYVLYFWVFCLPGSGLCNHGRKSGERLHSVRKTSRRYLSRSISGFAQRRTEVLTPTTCFMLTCQASESLLSNPFMTLDLYLYAQRLTSVLPKEKHVLASPRLGSWADLVVRGGEKRRGEWQCSGVWVCGLGTVFGRW